MTPVNRGTRYGSTYRSSCGGCLFGKPVSGFRDEFWLNINTNVAGTNPNTGQTETAQQFILDELAARLAKARSAGVDAVEFDNVDAYQNKTGLAISAAAQEQFDAAVANLAHTAGFAAGLKNDLGQASDLQPYFDFAINEQCWQYRECNFPAPGLQAWPSTNGKAVFNVEYKLAASKFCPRRTHPATTSIPSSKTPTSTTSPTHRAADRTGHPYEPAPPNGHPGRSSPLASRPRLA
jgi:hypothetical protein